MPRSDRRPEDPVPAEITQDTYRAFIESKRQSDPNYNVDMAATDFLRQTGYKVGDKILLVSDSRSDPATIIEAGNKWILLLSDNTSKMDAGQLLIFGKKIVLDR